MTFRNFAKFWLPLILWAIFIFSASTDALSAEHTSRFLVPFLRWLMPDLSLATIETIHAAIRKGSHLAEYAIFAALLWRAIHYGRNVRVGFRSEAVLISLVGILYAAADEFHQSFVTSRGSSVGDVIIDSGGILLTLFAVWVITRKRRREKSS